jgi:hypothetical protein
MGRTRGDSFTMSRILPNWIEGYLKYTENTEPARQFQLWSSMSVISSVLRRKTWLSLGRIKVYPNLYIVLVAPPGVARKSQSITFGLEFLTQISEISISADSITREALLDDLEKSATESLMPDNKTLRHASMSIVSKEFESFLGQKKENNRMIVMLTDLFDCPVGFKHSTKHSGRNVIEAVYVTLIAATTPDSLASSLPSTAIGGGLTSRILFVWGDKKYKKVSRPITTPAELELKEMLTQDLNYIAMIAGEYIMDRRTEQQWDDFYNGYEEMSLKRICQDPSFDSFYSRKPMYILKVAICVAASKRQETVLKWEDIFESMQFIEAAERGMANSFRAVGKSMVSSEIDTILQLVRNRKWIEEKELMTIVWKDMDSYKFDNIIETAMRTGRVKRSYMGPKHEPGIWYVWIEERKK